ncbi:hypothetical protein K439DRAFT_1649527 [Ramaria rubella]|nr:hypothetical protein K439DRAFT_1649527 [Ramaria rubella]
MPTPEFLLCLFIANYGAGSVSDDFINSWLAGIHRWHQINDAPWFGDKALSLTVKGASRLHIECLREHLDLPNTLGSAIFTRSTITFYGCCRLGELTIPSQHAFNPSFHVTLFTTIHIPWLKTCLGKDMQSSSSPITALEHHLVVNHSIPPSTPLFAWRTAADGWELMTKECFRIGGTTWLLLLGVDRWIIKVIGCWSSAAFLTYWRKIKRILPNFISDTYQALIDSFHYCLSLSSLNIALYFSYFQLATYQ